MTTDDDVPQGSIGELVMYLGCTEEPLYRRLKVHPSLSAAWEKHEIPGDLVWLAARIANEWPERAKVARLLAVVLDLVVPEAMAISRGALGAALALADIAIIDPEADRAAIVDQLRAKTLEAKGAVIALERKLRGRQLAAPYAERATHHGIEAMGLLLQGGWRGKAAERARSCIETICKLENAAASPAEILKLVRSEIPFLEFKTGWWGVNPPPSGVS